MKSPNTLYRFERPPGSGPGPGRILRQSPPTRGFLPIDFRLDLANHSPDGPSWGFEGSGPAQAALMILADFLEDDPLALELYQAFKRDVIAPVNLDRWSTPGVSIVHWLVAKAGVDPARLGLQPEEPLPPLRAPSAPFVLDCPSGCPNPECPSRTIEGQAGAFYHAVKGFAGSMIDVNFHPAALVVGAVMFAGSCCSATAEGETGPEALAKLKELAPPYLTPELIDTLRAFGERFQREAGEAVGLDAHRAGVAPVPVCPAGRVN